jgi:hypothetical protein
MGRFSKSSMVDYMSSRASKIAADYGLDINNGTDQLVGDLGTVQAKVAYGELIRCLELASPKPGLAYNKAIVKQDLKENADRLWREYGFDLNKGTSQLKGRLGTTQACIAYGDMHLCYRLIDWIDLGSMFRNSSTTHHK